MAFLEKLIMIDRELYLYRKKFIRFKKFCIFTTILIERKLSGLLVKEYKLSPKERRERGEKLGYFTEMVEIFDIYETTKYANNEKNPKELAEEFSSQFILQHDDDSFLYHFEQMKDISHHRNREEDLSAKHIICIGDSKMPIEFSLKKSIISVSIIGEKSKPFCVHEALD